MFQTICNLLLINLIVVLIHESGFIETIDEMIGEKYPLHHLPYPVRCQLCSVWWISLFYIIIAGPFNLLTIMLCLVNAHLTDITRPLARMIKNLLLKLIMMLNKMLNL